MYQNSLKKIIFLFLINQQIKSENEIAKLDVDILYESLCPDSLNFITKQLYPDWKELSPYINLKLIPFGKSASLESGNRFICQHGPRECEGNRIQSCALHALPHQNLQVEYVNCFMKIFKQNQLNESELGKICADAVGLDFSEILHCYTTLIGTNLQLSAEKETLKTSPKFVPTILYNQKFDQQLQDNSLIDFKGVVCYLISQRFPGVCPQAEVTRL